MDCKSCLANFVVLTQVVQMQLELKSHCKNGLMKFGGQQPW